MKIVDLDKVIDAIERTDWYHLFNGKLSGGAEGVESALYKAEDVYKAIKGVPHTEAIPIEFIKSEIEMMKGGLNPHNPECAIYAENLGTLIADWECTSKKIWN